MKMIELTKQDDYWMEQAIQLAKKAENLGEVPVGAVLIFNNELIGEGYNQPISAHDPTAHAEIMAIREAAKKLNNYRLVNTTLYVTLEPCLMCRGALAHARIARCVFGATDLRSLEKPFLNHEVNYAGGILKEECGQLLSQFFAKRR